MDESCMYEGLSAVCAVLAELEAAAPQRPALRLAERHLRLLAQLACGKLERVRREAGGGGPGCPPFRLPAPEEASHVVQ